MLEFIVKGPFDVPVKALASGAEFIDKAQLRALSTQTNGAGDKPGCYVFCWSASRGSLPVYVGKASKRLLKEAFNHRNVNNLNEYINERRRGKLQIYFVHQQRLRRLLGRGNERAIAEIEEFLIGRAALRNPNLLNIHGTGPSPWGIAGVANHRGGHPGNTVRDFKQMLGISTHKKPSADKREAVPDVIEPATTESEATPTVDIGENDEMAIGQLQ